MKKFFDLDPEESKGLDAILFLNANELKLDANLLAIENKSFSTATSLLVLSLEEIIKAILVLLHSEGFKVYKLEDAKKFFFDHKIRHQLGQLIETGLGLWEVKLNWNNEIKNQLFKKQFSSITNTLYRIIESTKSLAVSKQRVDKLVTFNGLKNNGLYVDYQDVLKDPKLIVTEKDYVEVKDIVERIFSFYQDLNEVFKTIPISPEEKLKFKKTKEDLTLFIDRALEDFSFKDLKT